jgi:nucleoside-diphosphate-sugar epimerase
MRVFITGAAGWIGQAVVKELVNNGHKVLGLVRSDKNEEILAGLGAEVLRGSLDDLEILKKGASQSDGVIHLAFGKDFSNFHALVDTDNAVIEAMGSALEGTNRPFIVTSGTLLLAEPKHDVESALAPFLNMLQARGTSETNALKFVPKGVRVIVMRLAPTNHGDGDQGFIPMLFDVAKKQGVSAYVNDGSSVWPAAHRFDTAVAYRLALENAKAGSVYEVAAETNIPTKDIAEAIGAKLNIPTASKPANEAMAHFGFIGLPFMTNNPVSGNLIKKELGWKPFQRSLLEDIKELTTLSPFEELAEGAQRANAKLED